MLKNKKHNKEHHTNKERNQRILHTYSVSQLPSEHQSKAVSIPLKKPQKPSIAPHRPRDPPKK